MPPVAPSVAGLVLAAGSGTRFGGPKALARSEDGTPWLHHAVTALDAGGCGTVLVSLGAALAEARTLVPARAEVVAVDDWADGLSASLAAGLRAAEATDADALVIVTVDTPELPAAAVARFAGLAATDALAQAVYRGRPGHPVLVGRTHWAALAASVTGDTGARDYLRAHDARRVGCDDLWSGEDRDRR